MDDKSHTTGIRPGKFYQDRFAPPPGPVSTEWLRQRATYLDGAAPAIQTGRSPNIITLFKAAWGLRAVADELDALRCRPAQPAAIAANGGE